MSIFNKDALSSFFGLSGEEDDYYDNYEEYEERKAVNEPPRRAARLNHNALFNNRKVTVSQLIHNKVSL